MTPDCLVASLTIKTSSRDQQQTAHTQASPQEDYLLSDHFQTMQTDCLFLRLNLCFTVDYGVLRRLLQASLWPRDPMMDGGDSMKDLLEGIDAEEASGLSWLMNIN